MALLQQGDFGDVHALVARIIAVLREYPLCHLSLRHQISGSSALVQIAQDGKAALALMLNLPAVGNAQEEAEITTVCFEKGVLHECVMAGSGRAKIISRQVGEAGDNTSPKPPVIKDISLSAGQYMCLDAEQEAKRVVAVEQPIVTLRLSRRDASGSMALEMRVADGEIIHRANANSHESRREMAMALLSHMGRTDAAPHLAEIAKSDATDAHRWEALRHALALDTGQGFRLLCAIAADTSDPLCTEAASLKAQLIAAHPVLAEFEAMEVDALCHA